MKSKSWIRGVTIAACLAASAWAGTFGKVVAIGGHASDLALDEGRGVLYIANFTANRIDVMSLSDNTVQRSINVASQPSSLSVSPDGKYLVVVHFGNFAPPASQQNALTVIDLTNNGKQTFALGNPPIGVAFGIDGRAVIVTTKEFMLFDPVLGTTQTLDTVSTVVSKTLPQPPATFPTTIKSAALGVSGDGLTIYGFGEGITFKYDVTSKQVIPGGYVSTVPIGPRVVSVNQDGSRYMAGWLMVDSRGTFINFFARPTGLLDVGTTTFDSARGLLYAQIPESSDTAGQPILKILDSSNMRLRERILLPENFSGKSVLNAAGNVMYGVSDSGVMVLPVGSLNQAPRLSVSTEDLVFRGNFCDRASASQSLTITDLSGRNSPFTLTSSQAGVRITPPSGVTPATVRISVDPNAFLASKGTSAVKVQVRSTAAVNVVNDVRVLVNTREPDQRGTFINVPGVLTDVLADPGRDRFYIVRQDTNEVLVFDATTNAKIASLPTGNTPTEAAITFDRRYLLVANVNSSIFNVFDLETLQATEPIRHTHGGDVRSIGVSANAILAVIIDSSGKGHVNKLDLATRTAFELPSLGVYSNENILRNTQLVASPNGSSILIAQSDGTLLLYDAVQDTFSASRKDRTALSGPVAASSYGQFVVGNNLLNSSLVTTRQFETATGLSSGFVFVDQSAIRITAPDAASPGIIQRVDLQTGEGIRATRTIEAPLLGNTINSFTRTLAILASRNAIIALTTSGFTVLPWNYDASVAPPQIDRVVNAADFTQPIAPGGLITVFGSNLSPISQGTVGGNLTTSLADSCLQVNGLSVPVLFVSPTQINAQLPNFDGNTTLRLNTPGGVSDNFNLTILPAAPSVFRIASVGSDESNAAIIRASNNQLVTPSNPVHRTDTIVIYATGLGRTSPEVPSGTPAPTDELAGVQIPVIVTIGGVPVAVEFAGLTPGQIGVYQINVRVNGRVPLGLSVPLVISQGTGSTSVPVRVVE